MKLPAFAALCLLACENTGTYTYTRDVQPLFAAHCEACHQAGNIAPFALQSYADAMAHRLDIAADVQNGTMPPWPPDDTCNSYRGDRSLSADEINTIVTWANYPSEGDPTLAPARITEPAGISRVDLALAMPAPYTPTTFPDDSHCFILDWPETTTQFVTGVSISPGNAKIVHNVLAYVATASEVSTYQAQATPLPDGGPGTDYPCFGGPVAGLDGLTNWLGFWVPGASYSDLPINTGIEVDPGSKVILEVHYSSSNGPGESDLSTLQLELATSVEKQGALLPFTNPFWVIGGGTIGDAGVGSGTAMDVPAGNADVQLSYQVDPGPYLEVLSNGAVSGNMPYSLYSVAAHLLSRGTSEELDVIGVDGGSSCLLRVPVWNLGWQAEYSFFNPVVVNPGDQLSISCSWNNSAANQPSIDGGTFTPVDMTWGVGPNDEMCLGMLYVTL